MNNNGQSRHRFQQVATGLLALFAFAILFIAGKLTSLPSDAPEKLASRAASMAGAQCTTALKALGVHYEKAEGEIRVVELAAHDARSLEAWAERGSLVIQSCPGYALESFCAGETCEAGSGLHIVMERRR